MMDTDRRGPFTDCLPTFDRWVIDPATRRVRETRIDDRPQEFPRHNPTVGLQRHRYGYTSEITLEGPNLHGAILKLDVETGTVEAHEFGAGRGGAEPVVVPKADAVQDITGAEVARIGLPQRVPYGFHGNWVSDRSVPPPA